MFDHIQITVKDVAASKRFYASALAPLGLSVKYDKDATVGIGGDGMTIPGLWLNKGTPPGKTHVALAAPNRTAVDAFHKAALASGGKDNGAPGVRADYHANYYGAFVIDPDGNNVEAVCHKPA
jgi:catechol 2,3-dioxygenase-like lactoylglutathione lyase family enzyme